MKVDTAVKFIATKKIPWTSRFQALHFNAAWTRNEKPMSTERRDRYQLIPGYSLLVGYGYYPRRRFHTEQQREKDKESNIFESGLRYQLNTLTVLSAGVGFGVGDNSPDVRVIFGIQRSLSF